MSPASIEIVIHQPVSFPKVGQQPIIEVACSFGLQYGAEDPCESCIDKLPVVGLRNHIVALAMKVLFFLRTIEEKTVHLERA